MRDKIQLYFYRLKAHFLISLTLLAKDLIQSWKGSEIKIIGNNFDKIVLEAKLKLTFLSGRLSHCLLNLPYGEEYCHSKLNSKEKKSRLNTCRKDLFVLNIFQRQIACCLHSVSIL